MSTTEAGGILSADAMIKNAWFMAGVARVARVAADDLAEGRCRVWDCSMSDCTHHARCATHVDPVLRCSCEVWRALPLRALIRVEAAWVELAEALEACRAVMADSMKADADV